MSKRLVVVWIVVQVVLATVALAHAEEASMHVEGSFTTRVVPCESLCTESTYRGDLVGTTAFTLISLAPSRLPEVSRYHGSLVLHTADGDLVGEDFGLWNTATGEYVDTYWIVDGTGVYEGASGLLFLSGTLDAVTGTGASRYDGWIVWPCD